MFTFFFLGEKLEILFCATPARDFNGNSRRLLFDGIRTTFSGFSSEVFVILEALELLYWSRRDWISGAFDGTIVHLDDSASLCHLSLCLLMLDVSFLHNDANFSSLFPRSDSFKHSMQAYFSRDFSAFVGPRLRFFSGTGIPFLQSQAE